MKREQLATGLQQIKEKIKELEKKRFKYFIHGKYITGHGQIELIETPEGLMKAFNHVKSQFKEENFVNDLANELGFTSIEIKDKEEQVYLGYTLEEWTEEFRMKASEIENQIQIDQLKKAKEKFKGYRTEEEKFEEDVNKFGALFTALGIGTESTSEKWEDVAKTDEQNLIGE